MGDILDNEGYINMTKNDWIQIGNRAYNANSRLLRGMLINHKIKIYKALIRLVVAYEGEMWILGKKGQETQRGLRERFCNMFMAWLGKMMNGCLLYTSRCV